jgi:hypothetical protein
MQSVRVVLFGFLVTLYLLAAPLSICRSFGFLQKGLKKLHHSAASPGSVTLFPEGHQAFSAQANNRRKRDDSVRSAAEPSSPGAISRRPAQTA